MSLESKKCCQFVPVRKLPGLIACPSTPTTQCQDLISISQITPSTMGNTGQIIIEGTGFTDDTQVTIFTYTNIGDIASFTTISTPILIVNSTSIIFTFAPPEGQGQLAFLVTRPGACPVVGAIRFDT